MKELIVSSFNRATKSIFNSGYSFLVLDILTFFFSELLFLMYLFDIKELFVLPVLSIVLFTFLLGQGILNLLGVVSNLSRLEYFAMSCPIGFSVAGLLYLPTVLVDYYIRPMITLQFYAIVGLYSLVIRLRRSEKPQMIRSWSYPHDSLILMVSCLFYLMSVLLIYPSFFNVVGTDMFALLVGWGKYIARSNHPTLNIPYLSYTLFGSVLFSIYDGNPFLLQYVLSLSITPIIMPSLIYALFKRYLSDINKRIPSVATTLWVFYSGFSWVGVLLYKLPLPPSPTASYLSFLWDKTYGEIARFSTPFLFFIPFSVSLVLYLMGFLIIGLSGIGKVRFILLFSSVYASMYLTHMQEAAIIAPSLFLAFLASEIHRKNAENAFLSIFLVSIFMLTITMLVNLNPNMLIINIFLLLLTSSWVFIQKLCVTTRKVKLILFRYVTLKGISLAAFCLYVVALVTWLITFDKFSASIFAESGSIGAIPWFMYPVFLGVNGLLASLTFIVDGHCRPVMYFFGGVLTANMLIGVAASHLNAYYFFTGFFENRIVYFLTVPISALASVTLVDIVPHFLINIRKKIFKTLAVSALIFIIVMAGVQSLSMKIWYNRSSPDFFSIRIADEEIDAFNRYLDVIPRGIVPQMLVLSDQSARSSYFVGNIKPLILTDNSIYLSSDLTSSLNMLHWEPYIDNEMLYLHSRDFQQMRSFSQYAFFMRYLIREGDILYSNNVTSIYQIKRPLPPTPFSKVVLMPASGSDSNELNAYASLLLGFAGINYTTHIGLYENGFNRDLHFSADDLSGWSIKGERGTIDIERLDKHEGSGSVKAIFTNTGPFSGIVLDFLQSIDFSEVKTVSFYLKVSNVDSLIRPLLILESQSGYLQFNLEKPLSNDWKEYIIGKEEAIWVGSPDWGNIKSLRFEIDVREPSDYEIFVDDVRINIPYFPNSDPLINQAEVIVLPFDPGEDQFRAYTKLISENGRTLIIINNNGFGSFAREFLAASENSLSFDGSDDYIALPTDAFSSLTSATIEFWVRIDDLSGTNTLFSVKEGTDFKDFVLLDVQEANYGKIRFVTKVGDASEDAIYSDTGIVERKWMHLVAVFGEEGKKMYVNGVLQSSTSTNTDSFASLPISQVTEIARAWYGGVYLNYLRGIIDETRIYNRALNATEVKEHYQGTYKNENGLALHLDYNGDANDRSPQENHGINYGATYISSWDEKELITAQAQFIADKNQTLSFENGIPIRVISPQHDVRVLAWYGNSQKEIVPFSLEKKIRNGTLIYLNTKPLFSFWRDGGKINHIAKQILNFSGAKFAEGQVQPLRMEAIFKTASLKGEVELKTKTLSLDSPKRKIMLYADEQKVELTPIKAFFTSIDEDFLTIKANQLEIMGSEGFYARLAIKGDFQISAPRMDVSMILINGTTLKLSNVNVMTFSGEERTVGFARQPQITDIGLTNFTHPFILKPVGKTEYAKSDGLIVDGKTVFSILFAAEYIAVKELKTDGSLTRIPPLVQYEKIPLVSPIFPFILMVLLSICFSNLKNSRTKIKWTPK